ncbi:MAG: response regulator [Flavobacteriales bacterium]
MNNRKILWVDDEIDHLKPHIMFLNEKGYEVETVTNGSDALDSIKESNYDIIFLDENMPGLSGMETLTEMKEIKPYTPVIIITKNEGEDLMEEAIGSKISDYLIKPVNPKQILLSIKKNLEDEKLVSEKTATDYQKEFSEIGMKINEKLSIEEWKDLYKRLVNWNLKLDNSSQQGMKEAIDMQWEEANHVFSGYVDQNYVDWINGNSNETPLMSHQLFSKEIVDKVENNEGPYFMILIDNLRYDQWKILEPLINEYFQVDEEGLYFSILPTATHYARNSLFAGMLPTEIQKKFPEKWKSEDDEGSKNEYEEDFLQAQLKLLGKDLKCSYHKITSHENGKKLSAKFNNLLDNDLVVIVYNFVDMLSHARTEMEVIKELAEDESAYRSITHSWFQHSPLHEIMKQISEHNAKCFLTTDHGTIRTSKPSKVVGDRNTNTNIRYKEGKSLKFDKKDVMDISDPDKIYLPKKNVSSRYIFAKSNKYFVYPNNYNYYVKFFKNTFQHGGISMEEMMIPYVSLLPRR